MRLLPASGLLFHRATEERPRLCSAPHCVTEYPSSSHNCQWAPLCGGRAGARGSPERAEGEGGGGRGGASGRDGARGLPPRAAGPARGGGRDAAGAGHQLPRPLQYCAPTPPGAPPWALRPLPASSAPRVRLGVRGEGGGGGGGVGGWVALPLRRPALRDFCRPPLSSAPFRPPTLPAQVGEDTEKSLGADCVAP